MKNNIRNILPAVNLVIVIVVVLFTSSCKNKKEAEGVIQDNKAPADSPGVERVAAVPIEPKSPAVNPNKIDIDSVLDSYELLENNLISLASKREDLSIDQTNKNNRILGVIGSLKDKMSNAQLARKKKMEIDFAKRIRVIADDGGAFAQLLIGVCYLRGEGVEANAQQAVDSFRKSVAWGCFDAEAILGMCYAEGLGVKGDMEYAAERYRNAANHGSAFGQMYLAMCYSNGDGVEKDSQQAVDCYRKAAETGLAEAQLRLGNCYYVGYGVKMDIGQAFDFFRKSAASGHAGAQFKLAMCYEDGKGVAKNPSEAHRWYGESAAGCWSEAQSRLKILSQPLVEYQSAKHGPKIKDFFVGMTTRQFEETASKNFEGLRSEIQKRTLNSNEDILWPFCGTNPVKERRSEEGSKIFYYSTGAYEVPLALGSFNASGELVDLLLFPQTVKNIFKCDQLKNEEFASLFSDAYHIAFSMSYEERYVFQGLNGGVKTEFRNVFRALAKEGVAIEIDDFNVEIHKVVSEAEIKKAFD